MNNYNFCLCDLQNTTQRKLWPIVKNLATQLVKLFDGAYLRQVNPYPTNVENRVSS